MTDIYSGPAIYENWHKKLSDLSWKYAFEFEIFTDAHIIGEERDRYGPYQLFNTVSFTGPPPIFGPRIVARAFIHGEDSLSSPLPDMSITDDDRFHGGDLRDELAALISLSLGIRCRAGRQTRDFHPSGDDLGSPKYLGNDPVMPNSPRVPTIPRLHTKQNITGCTLLDILTSLSPTDANSLIKASRLYQEALLISDSDPALAWILLVSSIESAAQFWAKDQGTPIDRLNSSMPDLFEFLSSRLDSDDLHHVADVLSDLIGSTSKFIRFVMDTKPTPPPEEDRPPDAWRISYSRTNLRRVLSKIYNYRSKSLHTGSAFPLPMCEVPMRYGEKNAPAEKPMGLASSARGSTWVHTDTPILLHTFEHIVRTSLTNWFISLPEGDSD